MSFKKTLGMDSAATSTDQLIFLWYDEEFGLRLDFYVRERVFSLRCLQYSGFSEFLSSLCS